MQKMATLLPIRESFREVNDTTWIVGDKLLLSRTSTKTAHSWPDIEDGFYYDICELSEPPTLSHPLPSTSQIQKVYDVGEKYAHAAWKIGTAFLKIKGLPNPYETREHITLEAVKGMGLTSFDIPEVLHHYESDGRYYLTTSQMPGQRIEEAWSTLEQDMKAQVVKEMVKICLELAKRTSNKMTGVDGNHLNEYYLAHCLSHQEYDFSPAALQKTCEELGMDCGTLHFYHTDMGPTNVFVDIQGDGGMRIGVIDWEAVGYVPKEWIRTKFCSSGGMNFEVYEMGDERRKEWRTSVQLALGEEGFGEVADEWVKKRVG